MDGRGLISKLCMSLIVLGGFSQYTHRHLIQHGLNPHHIGWYAGEALGVLNLIQAILPTATVFIHHAFLHRESTAVPYGVCLDARRVKV